jgi:hypothetical protein
MPEIGVLDAAKLLTGDTEFGEQVTLAMTARIHNGLKRNICLVTSVL